MKAETAFDVFKALSPEEGERFMHMLDASRKKPVKRKPHLPREEDVKAYLLRIMEKNRKQ